ncbi:alginate lyase family protein [Candidatus Uabimicrobium amorphum]|uniref:Uncharacterized protein n=1 Tax=Uabimicrobium amorphum TaxID=2596890 RepID=A0A5S9IH53_UABAM|nr:alginate lyase family protein [Candidatus Uabimicrobium amorphum]BBM81683.1 hypothetical protein UABAM_00022 [Candidatus Uabimicrobium amorphum]
MKWKYLFAELKDLGWRKSVFRIKYEIARKWLPYTRPVKKNSKLMATISLQEWSTQRVAFFGPDFTCLETKNAYCEMFCDDDKNKIIEYADCAINGQIFCFSKWWGDYGNPIDWHKNPQSGVSWPKDVHYSQIYSHAKECGDIKLVWELNRFPHVYFLVRAYLLSGDEKYAAAFFQQLHDWKEQNPYRAGANWANGQELAIRSLAWIWALYIFRQASCFGEKDFQCLQQLLYLHAEHIYREIHYARYAVHNNHLIGEALGLYAIGSLFPWLPKTKKWRALGKQILQSDCLNQFYADGGYCQSSHTYHRLALHYYIWYCRIAESIGDEISSEVYDLVVQSSDYLLAFMNSTNGHLNNWGCNDGALFCPWTQCGYRDFRPLLSAAKYLTSGKRLFVRGPWEEELFFLFGRESVQASISPPQLSSKSFPAAGLHTLRVDQQNFAIFRCGSVIDRFGQADQLHVDICWRDIPIAVDAGTYSYYQKEDHKYFMGTHSHNTISVDDKNQMYLLRPFKWLYWTKAKLLCYRQRQMCGEHYGYAGVVHERDVRYENNAWEVKDSLKVKKTHKYVLHWLITFFYFTIVEKNANYLKIRLQTTKGNYYLQIESSSDAEFFVQVANANDKQGWLSQFYGHVEKAISIRAITTSNSVTFVSHFTDNEIF